jgi:ankyrin repeat protein
VAILDALQDGTTPLHTAAMAGIPSVVLLLLERGAEALQRDGQGEVALTRAVLGEMWEAASALLQAPGAEHAIQARICIHIACM